jgi:alkanesulfonate monooxygenase SsuD/methylene tetrahydromethanopterin reductase-like flavin-dependent oxidoreductase (luciferase family)
MRSDLSVHWFLPTAGDSRDVVGFGPTVSRRDPDLDYLGQVARAAEKVGFDAVLTPTGTWCEDAWVATAALIGLTSRLRAGFGLVRSGAGTALVGSHDEVAERIAEYHEVGFDHFILSGQPHLEEAWWFGEGVIPRLREAGLLGSAEPPPNAARPVLAPASAS